jgi:hypothetical protein
MNETNLIYPTQSFEEFYHKFETVRGMTDNKEWEKVFSNFYELEEYELDIPTNETTEDLNKFNADQQIEEIIKERTKLAFIDLKEQNKIIDRIFQRSFDEIKTKEFYLEINGLNLLNALLQERKMGLSFLFEKHGITKLNIEILLANVDSKHDVNNNLFKSIAGYKEKFHGRNQIRLWIIILVLTMAFLIIYYSYLFFTNNFF